MKKNFFRFMMYCILTIVVWWPQLASYGLADEGNKGEMTELKNTIARQEEEIKKLQSEIKTQQENIERLKKENGSLNQGDPVAKALQESWGCGYRRAIQVSNEVLKISFADVNDIIAFFDTGSEVHARSDLAVFLKKAGLEKGTIEYYSADRKLYSISGNLTKSETAQYY
jgi:cell division protein FtsB